MRQQQQQARAGIPWSEKVQALHSHNAIIASVGGTKR